MLKTVQDMTSQQIRNMIATLNPQQRETLSLATYATSNPLDIINSQEDGLSYDAIANIASIDKGTVRSRLHRAKASLKSMADSGEFKTWENKDARPKFLKKESPISRATSYYQLPAVKSLLGVVFSAIGTWVVRIVSPYFAKKSEPLRKWIKKTFK
jgi:hypothetical protein